jgi:uncharacterized protein
MKSLFLPINSGLFKQRMHFLFNPKFWLRVTVALVSAWILTIIGLSWYYTHLLLHPVCPPPSQSRPGYLLITLATPDGAQLSGWWKPPDNGVVILLLPGHAGNRDVLMPEAEILVRNGYGVLSLDSRGCSNQKATLGYREAEDVGVMLTFLRSQTGVEKVGVLGFSAGGVAAILSAAQEPEIQAVIAQGNYHNLDLEINNRLRAPLSLDWQMRQGVLLAIWLQTGIFPANMNPARDLVKIAPRPVLLIHGEEEADNNLAHEQYTAARHPKQLWIVQGTGHGGYLEAAPEEYEQRIIQFFKQSFTE